MKCAIGEFQWRTYGANQVRRHATVPYREKVWRRARAIDLPPTEHQWRTAHFSLLVPEKMKESGAARVLRDQGTRTTTDSFFLGGECRRGQPAQKPVGECRNITI